MSTTPPTTDAASLVEFFDGEICAMDGTTVYCRLKKEDCEYEILLQTSDFEPVELLQPDRTFLAQKVLSGNGEEVWRCRIDNLEGLSSEQVGRLQKQYAQLFQGTGL